MTGGQLILVAKGQDEVSPFSLTPNNIARLISSLIRSEEVAVFQNLDHLKKVAVKRLPILPVGYFWYKNGKSWTVRKLCNAPEVVIDLDIYLRDGIFAGYNLSVNKNLVDTSLQTVRGKKDGKRDTTYGGYCSAGFLDLETGLSDTIGHGVAYADSLSGVTKTNAPIMSDENPRNYSPEKSTRKGGSDFGQSIRNHQLEQLTRKYGGMYREINFFRLPQQVCCGLFVPAEKHLVRVLPQETSYVKFTQGVDYKLRDGKKVIDLWNANKQSLADIPSAQVLDLSTTILPVKPLDIGFGYFLTYSKPLVFTSDVELKVGDQYLVDDGKESRIILSTTKLESGEFEYTYYRFTKLIYPHVAVYLSESSQSAIILNELEESGTGYKTRFSPLENILILLGKQIETVTKYFDEHKTGLSRIYSSAAADKKTISQPKQTRKKDVSELTHKTQGHIVLVHNCFLEAKTVLLSHTVWRSGIFEKDLPILFSNLRSSTEYFDIVAQICHMIEKLDREALGEVYKLIEKTTYHLESFYALLKPPELDLHPAPDVLHPSM